jgi:hypothetical protein
MKEIKKQQWSRWCRDLSSKYQFARTKVLCIDADGDSTTEHQAAPLSRLSLARRRGKISAFEVSLCEIRNGSPTTSSIAIGAPIRILSDASDDDGTETIEIYNEDGHRLVLRLFGQTIEESYESLVEEMAYNLAELRGFVPGQEHEDWFRAEKLVRKAASLQG